MERPPKIGFLPRPFRITIAGFMVAGTLIVALAGAFENPFFRAMDLYLYDMFMRTDKTPDTIPHRITIVDIDEKSLAAAGQWPWPRYRLARLVRQIHEENPFAMAMDILFPEPDRSSLKRLVRQFETDFNLSIGITGVPEGLSDNDGFFSHVLAQTGTVGARYFYFDHTSFGAVCKNPPFDIRDPDGILALHEATGVLCNTPVIETRLEATGFMNNQYEPDGLLRQTPLLIRSGDTIFPHLSLALFMTAHDIYTARVTRGMTGPILEIGSHEVPVTRQGTAFMRFKGPGFSHRFISAVDLLNNRYDPADIRDKMVLIGSSAVAMSDIHPTALDPHFPGVEISAVLIENILDKTLMQMPSWKTGFILVSSLVTGLIMTGLFYGSLGPWLLFSATLAWTSALFSGGLFCHRLMSLSLPVASPLFLAWVLFSLIALFRFAIEKREAFLWYERLADAQQLAMGAMVSMVETRDPETGEHIIRTQHYARAVALQLRKKGLFTELLTDHYIKTLFLSVPLHDIGKVGTPDNILLKPGRLTDEEFTIMKMHADHGRNIIIRASRQHKGSGFLDMGAQIAGTHHERWNGDGYPLGLSRDEIPLAGRIMAIADVYDALISRRCYKPPFSHEKAIEIILEEKGKLFDPLIVDTFLEIEPEIRRIAEDFRDEEEETE